MARQVSEIVHSNERVLIVSKEVSQLSKQLSKRLEQYDVAIQRTNVVPPSYERFNRIFFLKIKPDSQLIIPTKIKTTIILIKPFGKTVTLSSPSKHIKYIILNSENITEDQLDQILWFSISSSNEQLLDMRSVSSKQRDLVRAPLSKSIVPKRQAIISTVVLLFIAVCFGFIVPLLPATLLHVAMLESYTKDDYASVEFLQPASEALSHASETLFIPARPIYSLFSVSLFAESYIRFNSYTDSYFKVTKQLALAQQQLMRDFTSKQSLDRVGALNIEMQEYLERINTNIPNYTNLETLRKSLKNKLLISEKIAKALPVASAIISDPSDQTLMILIINNSRVRGAGGIIDSVGIVKFSNHRVVSSRFFSAKQLNPKQLNLETISPMLITYTPAEATVLNDSTTSVDLFDAQEKLRSSLSSILGGRRPTMTLLITTTAMQNILSTFPELQLNGSREIVTSENISIKQRLYGSNPSFIPAVMERMSETVGTINPNALFSSIITSFNEKQLALLSTRPAVQQMMDNLYWSGKTISPKCLETASRCINDYLFSVDQDLSARTGSSYVQKSQSKIVRFLNSTTLESTVRISWKNESPLPANQGGNYKLYTQILLPPNTRVSQITKNNVLVEQVDTLSGQYNILGLYLEVAPKQVTELAITYTMPARLRETTNYQLITQKQLGSFTSNVSFDLMLPEGYVLGSTNIDAVVNNERISYNGILNTDKLFFVQMKKK